MIRKDRDFSEAVARAVREAESGTAAELIVVVASRSGSYLDVAVVTGFLVAACRAVGRAVLAGLFSPLAIAAKCLGRGTRTLAVARSPRLLLT